MKKMYFRTFINSKTLLKSCKVTSLTLIILVLAIQSVCTKVKHCRLSSKGSWICEGSLFVPKFPPDTSTITLTDTRFFHLDNNTFQNLTELHLLRRLLIKTSEIKYSSTGVFSYLKYLEELHLIKCFIEVSEFKKLFLGLPANIIQIVIIGIDLRLANKDHFEGIKRTNVTVMSIIECELDNFDGDYLTGMNRLDKLDISRNSITSIVSWGYLPNLNFLDMYYNKITHLKPFKNTTGFSFYPKLEKLFLSFSNYNILDSSVFFGLDKLHTVGIFVGNIQIFRANVFQQMKYLRAVSVLAKRHSYIRFEDNVFKSKTLESVELNNIHFQFNKVNQSASLFQSCTQLTNLILRNVTGRMYFNILLKPLKKLENLEIYKGVLSEIPDTVCTMNKLQTLTIHYTTVDKWDKVKCPAMISLRTLVLAHNKIRVVNETLFSTLLFSNKDLKMDFSFNPYVCDCNALWFRDWAKKEADRVLKYKNYHCFSPGALQHIRLENFSLSWEYCESRHKPSTIALSGIIIATLSVIFVLTAIVSYTKRWSIRFCIYQAVVKRKRYKALVNDGQYEYDAFVCYCSADINWILNKLLPVLEEENHFHLCLHDRDFLVGNDIVDNIVESMQKSRMVVLVLSDNFAQSSWCQFEASIAQQKILEEHQDNIIPVLLNDIPADLQTKRLTVLLRQKTYLEWPNENQYEQMFWERFIRLLNEKVTYNEI